MKEDNKDHLLEILKTKITSLVAEAVPFILFYKLISGEDIEINQELHSPVFDEMKTLSKYKKYIPHLSEPRHFDYFKIAFKLATTNHQLTKEEQERIMSIDDDSILEDFYND